MGEKGILRIEVKLRKDGNIEERGERGGEKGRLRIEVILSKDMNIKDRGGSKKNRKKVREEWGNENKKSGEHRRKR